MLRSGKTLADGNEILLCRVFTNDILLVKSSFIYVVLAVGQDPGRTEMLISHSEKATACGRQFFGSPWASFLLRYSIHRGLIYISAKPSGKSGQKYLIISVSILFLKKCAASPLFGSVKTLVTPIIEAYLTVASSL